MTRRKKTQAKIRDCRWCGKPLDSPSHRDYSESFCFILNEKKIRSRNRPRVKSLSEVYLNEKLRPEFIGTDMEDKLMARQRKLAIDASLSMGDNGYHVPKNVEVFYSQGFTWGQIAVKKPWAVYVLIKTANGTKRRRARFNNLAQAIEFHKRASKQHSAGIVSLGRAYDLPEGWRFRREKIPQRFKWCPHCAAFRVFKRVIPEQKFFAMVKRPTSDPKKLARGIKYEWTNRQLWLTECQLCGNTNRGQVFRRSNQPWEVRRIKKGVRRIKPRPGTPKRRPMKRLR